MKMVKLDDSVHLHLKVDAAKAGMTLSNYVDRLLKHSYITFTDGMN